MSKRTGARPLQVVVSCEHGGNDVPKAYATLFRDAQKVLDSHRGYDPGSLEIGRYFGKRFAAPLVAATVTRLLVEINRSLHHASLFSEWSAPLPAADRQKLIDMYYRPYRDCAEALVRDTIQNGKRVVHISMHTFTPVLNGRPRRADVGLLYDPQRTSETKLCKLWQKTLVEKCPELVVRRNYPYRGASDGFTTALRKRYSDGDYCGIELELNQKWLSERAGWRTLIRDVADAFDEARNAF